MAIHCPVCGWTFRAEKSLRRHMAAHHSEEEQKLASRPPESSAPGPPPGDGHPGWYPNPDAEGTRYWDGTKWVGWNKTDPSAAKRKVNGINTVRLTWNGANSTGIDVFRDGLLVAQTTNDGRYEDSTGDTGRARYVYKVCEGGTQTCSNEVTVTFQH